VMHETLKKNTYAYEDTCCNNIDLITPFHNK